MGVVAVVLLGLEGLSVHPTRDVETMHCGGRSRETAVAKERKNKHKKTDCHVLLKASDVDRGQTPEDEAEAEDKTLRTRPRPRTKPRGRGRGRRQNHEAKDKAEDIFLV